MIKKFIYKIKKRENKFYDSIYWSALLIRSFSFPCIKPLHFFLRMERTSRLGLCRGFLKAFYYTPLFKSACRSYGKNLNLIEGYPYVDDTLEIHIGNNVRIYGSAGFNGYKVFQSPKLTIGNNTFIGPNVRLGIGKEIKIGNNCLIAARVFICDHDGHPLDPNLRRKNLPVAKEEIKPIIIEDDAWIGEGVFICKGVHIGKGAVIAARSVVTKNVPSLTVAGGNPAKIIKEIKTSKKRMEGQL